MKCLRHWALTGLVPCICGLQIATFTSSAATIGLAPGMPTQQNAVESRELVEATQAFKANNLPLTRQRLVKARDEHPELPPVEVMLANMYFSDNQSTKGRQMLEQAAVKHPDDPEPHLNFADLAFNDGRLTDAQVQYEKGGQLANAYDGPGQRQEHLKVRATAGLAKVAERRGQFDAANKFYSAVLKLRPEDANAHFRLGNVLFALGRGDEAIVEFQKAAALQESAPSPMLTMADLCRQTGELDEAEQWLNKAIDQSPDDAQPLIAMARWQLEVRNAADTAVEYTEKARSHAPESLDIAFLEGMIAWQRGDLATAEKKFESIALRQPQNAMATQCLAGVLAEQEDNAKRARAWDLARIVVSDTNQSAESVATLGWVAYHLGKLDDAQRYLQMAVAGGAGRDASYYLARTLYRQGHIADARKAMERALRGKGLFVHLDTAQNWNQELGSDSN